MYSLRLKCTVEEVDFLSAELWEAGTAGIREVDEDNSVLLIAGFETNDLRSDLLARFAERQASWTQESAIDWIAETERAWPARRIGQRIFLAPPWCRDTTPDGYIRLVHNPGLACGTGEHPCTQLALAAIEAANVAGETVVDIGTGSGLLAVAAAHFKAHLVVGVDTDEAALSAARENFALNGFWASLIAGSADCLRDRSADVTIANISGTVLLSLADELRRVTAQFGTLVLTGFTEYELPIIEDEFGKGAVTSCGEWRCLSVLLS